MQITFDCPRCLKTDAAVVEPTTAGIACRHCGWTRDLEPNALRVDVPTRCLACGCEDLWRQKDFPPQLGLTMVGLGIVGSTVAVYSMRPVLALGILMSLALIDMLLYTVMPDCLVCYRCHARHRGTGAAERHAKFDLELNERYRQEAARKQSMNAT